MKKLLIKILLLSSLFMVGCASNMNPFICDNSNADKQMQQELGAIQSKKFDPSKLDSALFIGTTTVSPNNFTSNLDFNGLIQTAMSSEDMLHGDGVIVINTSIDACNPLQYQYIVYIITKFKQYGVPSDKIVFVDAKTNNYLQSTNQLESTPNVASIKFDFYTMLKSDL